MKPRWCDLSSLQKSLIFGLAAVQIVFLVAALLDIHKRPAYKIRGKKLWWRLGSFVDFIGPLAYFCFGRKGPGF